MVRLSGEVPRLLATARLPAEADALQESSAGGIGSGQCFRLPGTETWATEVLWGFWKIWLFLT